MELHHLPEAPGSGAQMACDLFGQIGLARPRRTVQDDLLLFLQDVDDPLQPFLRHVQKGGAFFKGNRTFFPFFLPLRRLRLADLRDGRGSGNFFPIRIRYGPPPRKGVPLAPPPAEKVEQAHRRETGQPGTDRQFVPKLFHQPGDKGVCLRISRNAGGQLQPEDFLHGFYRARVRDGVQAGLHRFQDGRQVAALHPANVGPFGKGVAVLFQICRIGKGVVNEAKDFPGGMRPLPFVYPAAPFEQPPKVPLHRRRNVNPGPAPHVPQRVAVGKKFLQNVVGDLFPPIQPLQNVPVVLPPFPRRTFVQGNVGAPFGRLQIGGDEVIVQAQKPGALFGGNHGRERIGSSWFKFAEYRSRAGHFLRAVPANRADHSIFGFDDEEGGKRVRAEPVNRESPPHPSHRQQGRDPPLTTDENSEIPFRAPYLPGQRQNTATIHAIAFEP